MRMQWIQKGPNDYFALYSNHFTNNCFEQDLVIAARCVISK